jgi:UDP-N-acetylglucosamine acyltransferase
MKIHSSAVIEPGAKIGVDVEIGPFCYVCNDVEIGDGCKLSSHVTILPHTKIGSGCNIHSNAVLGDLPQDVAFQEGISYVIIGNNCQIREGVTIHRGTKAGTVTKVGDDCMLMANSHLAHNVQLGNQVIVANGALLAGYVQVGDRAFISGNCLVHQFARVGKLVMMSGGSATQRDIPPFCMTRNQSADSVMGLNAIGMRRAGISSQDRLELKRAFKVLYKSGLLIPEALIKLQTEFDNAFVKEMCDFIQASQRGICRHIRVNATDDSEFSHKTEQS